MFKWIKSFIKHLLTMEESKWVYCVEAGTMLTCFRLRHSRRLPNGKNTVSPPFNQTDKQFIIAVPKSFGPLGVKDPSFAVTSQKLLKLLGDMHVNQIYPLHQWKAPVKRSRTISEAVPSSFPAPVFDYSDESSVRRRLISEGGEGAALGRLRDYKKGMLIELRDHTHLETLRELTEILSEHNFHNRRLISGESGWCCVTDGADLNVFCEIHQRLWRHPAFEHPTYNHVFHSIDDVLQSLNMIMDDDITPLVTFAEECQRDINSRAQDLQPGPSKPFIVVEGLDGTGKSTVVDKLAQVLNAERLQTPPQELLDIRKTFDNKPTLIRRLYYCVGNYMVSKNIRELCRTQAVIMDRFWQSTAAYTIATDCGVGDEGMLPPTNDPIYRWPQDLVQPTLIILLYVSEEERARRVSQRQDGGGPEITTEEENIAANAQFRKRITEAYKRMHGVRKVEICADDSKERVLDQVMDTLRNEGILTH